MDRKRRFVVAAVTLAGIIVCARLAWHIKPVSTHHSQITVSLAQHDKDRWLSEYEQVVRIVEAWAGSAGFYRVPVDRVDSMRQSPIGGSPAGDGWVTYFRETMPRSTTFPTEVMIVGYAEAPARVLVSMSEGYYRRATRGLRVAHDTITNRLEEQYPGKVEGRVW